MGSFQAKEKSTIVIECRKDREVEALRTKVKLQKEEMKEIMKMREIESQTYEQEKMIFVLKEAEWKMERKRLRNQVQEFSRQLEEKELKIKGLMIDEELEGDKYENDRTILGNSYLMECMREERSRRDEAVDKWKRLYLAIRTELDHVIKMTHQDERMNWRLGEANLINELYRELEAKEDTIEHLTEQLASKEQDKKRIEREADILKQSLRIMTHRKGKSNAKNPKKSLAKQKRDSTRMPHRQCYLC